MTDEHAPERDNLPFAVGLCPEPSHAAEFYMPLTKEDVAREQNRECPLDCPHTLVVYERSERP